MNIRFPSEHMRFDPSKILDCFDLIPDGSKIPFFGLITKWLRSNGASWTASRLKDLRQRAIAVRGNQVVKTDHWFKLTSAKKLAGTLSFIDKISKQGSNAEFRELIQMLSLYTAFKLPDHASEGDFRKMYDAMSHTSDVTTYPTIPSKLVYPLSAPKGSDERILFEIFDRGNNFWDVALRSIKKERLAIVPPQSLIANYSIDSDVIRHALWLLLEESIWNSRNVPPRQTHRDSPYLKGTYGLELPRRHEVPKGMGNVRYRIQPNGKVRFYAAPHPAVQELLKPLGDLVYDLLRFAEWDCTFDQNAGILKIQKWLREGKSCSSIDLTSATDIFPLEFQKNALLKMVSLFQGQSHIYITSLKWHLELFTYISRGDWNLPEDMCDALGLQKGTTHRWKTGQPLGTYPSFGIFALGHALLVLRACSEVGVPAVEAPQCFVILGDDVCISRDDVAQRYQVLLDTLGVKISNAKSIFKSNTLAEFAGKIITRTEAFYKPKYLPVTDKTVVSLVDTFGPKVTKCYNLFQRAMISLPFPVGRELNSDGFPLRDRYEWMMRLESMEIDKRRVIGPSDAVRRKVELDHVSDRPDLNVYIELPKVIGYAGFKPGPADDVFFSRNHELRSIWRSFPAYVNPKSTFRYSYYTPSSWTKKARAVLPS